MYFATTDTYDYRFSTEQARDEWVACAPTVRKTCDPPADTSGFRDCGEGVEFRPREDGRPVSPPSETPLTDAAEKAVEGKYQTLYHSRRRKPIDSDLARKLERAFSCALKLLEVHEPPDSRAVSDIFVALATVACGNDDAESWKLIDATLAADLPKHELCACHRVTVVEEVPN